MAMIEYTLDDHVAVLTMNSGENRFNFDFFDAFLSVMDEIENQTSATTLVVTSADEKIFSNGIDLDWLMPMVQKEGMEASIKFIGRLNEFLKRIYLFPLITIAAISGHAFAGGAILCCAFDFRFMRTDRGYFCLPEVDLKIPFTPGLLALLKKAIPVHIIDEMQYTGKRYTAQELLDFQFIKGAHHIDDLMSEVMVFAASLNKDRGILGEMKRRMYKDIVHAMDVEDAGMGLVGS